MCFCRLSYAPDETVQPKPHVRLELTASLSARQCPFVLDSQQSAASQRGKTLQKGSSSILRIGQWTASPPRPGGPVALPRGMGDGAPSAAGLSRCAWASGAGRARVASGAGGLACRRAAGGTARGARRGAWAPIWWAVVAQRKRDQAAVGDLIPDADPSASLQVVWCKTAKTPCFLMVSSF
jgi:hypothetical protein